MNETYTLKEAMERLGVKGRNAFLRMERRYPEAFAIVKRGPDRNVCYDKTTLDKFAERRAYFKQERT